jgi:hypothetical protein
MQGAGQIEELASRIPGLGAFIKHSRGTSVLQAARAQVDEAARIAGEPIPPEGLSVHGAVENVRAGLDRRYDSLLSRMRANRSTRAPTTQLPGGGIVNVPGDAFEHVIAQTQIQAGNVLTGTAELKAFDNIIKRVNRDFDAQGNISGENLKELERFLRHEHSRYERSASPATQDLAPFIAQIQDGFNAMLRLGNAPADVAELDRLDRAYSQFKMVERASTNKAALAKTGEFTPAAMLGEVSHRALKRGEAGRRLMSTETAQGQRLAAQSSRVLGNKLPDSGTPTGQFFLEMLSSPTAAGTAGAFGYPKLAAAAAAIPSIYNQPVLRFLQNRALSPYGNLGPLLGIAGAGVETSQAQKPVQDTLPNALVPSDWQVPK